MNNMFTKLILVAFLVALYSVNAVATTERCQQDNLKVQVLGSGGPEVGDGRASTGYVFWSDNRAKVLIDLGTGSLLNFEKSGAKIEDLDAVLLSHLHTDHSADLPGLVKASFFSNRARDLDIYGPTGNDLVPGTIEFVHLLLGANGAFRYLANFVPKQPKDSSSPFLFNPIEVPAHQTVTYKISDDITIRSVAIKHGPLPARAWRIDSMGCSVGFTGDISGYNANLIELFNGLDVLITHNAIPESAGPAAKKLHLPPSELGKLAKDVNAGQLVLSHRMLRSLGKEDETLLNVQKTYQGPVKFAEDLDEFPLYLTKD